MKRFLLIAFISTICFLVKGQEIKLYTEAIGLSYGKKLELEARALQDKDFDAKLGYSIGNNTLSVSFGFGYQFDEQISFIPISIEFAPFKARKIALFIESDYMIDEPKRIRTLYGVRYRF